jgi:hypothetical protein
MPLDFIKLSRSHTGKYLEEMVQLVVKKFGVQNKVHIVCRHDKTIYLMPKKLIFHFRAVA